MKIGTLTFCSADNYGLVLQTYALRKKLSNMDLIGNPDVLVGFLPWAKNVQEICQ